ncbi:MAG TPA: hypothetical protein DD633_10755 [Sphaerochaeta sp.]|nr:hypothetical protein [Sphaerochaeta sp.]
MRTLFIIGDSLAQSYQNEPDGQCGWGSYLFGQLTGELPGRVPSPHGEGVLFQGNEVVVANYAKAGRSTRTFVEEKRFDIVKQQLCPSDVLLINYGHNDASFTKQERNTTIRQFQDVLGLFASYAYRKEAEPFFIAPIPMLQCEATKEGEVKLIAELFPSYRQAMKQCAYENSIQCVDLQEQPCSQWYCPDGVHLTKQGAVHYAHFIAKDLIKYSQ